MEYVDSTTKNLKKNCIASILAFHFQSIVSDIPGWLIGLSYIDQDGINL